MYSTITWRRVCVSYDLRQTSPLVHVSYKPTYCAVRGPENTNGVCTFRNLRFTFFSHFHFGLTNLEFTKL